MPACLVQCYKSNYLTKFNGAKVQFFSLSSIKKYPQDAVLKANRKEIKHVVKQTTCSMHACFKNFRR